MGHLRASLRPAATAWIGIVQHQIIFFFFLIDLFLWVPLLSDRSLVNENQIKEKLHNETRRNQRMPGGFANHQIPVAALNKIGSSSNLALEYAI